ncbi:hypothetical protein CMV_026282 [Castanea mollissima]|uniref:Uncharacterized protein n=1 Tax=Castanea mollissima TaxID=60419 RepID=A0A8J4VFE3_9ROSI|nr:hypothetical protein CMV_026282 [Castanea mollissima]
MERLPIVYRSEVIVFVAEVKSPEVNEVGKAAARVDGTTCTETTLAKLKANISYEQQLCYFCLQILRCNLRIIIKTSTGGVKEKWMNRRDSFHGREELAVIFREVEGCDEEWLGVLTSLASVNGGGNGPKLDDSVELEEESMVEKRKWIAFIHD